MLSALGDRAHCLAIDLPGIDGSETPPASHDKGALATYVHGLVDTKALRTGFGWYRAFAQDEKDNIARQGHRVDAPVLYTRADREYGDVERYVAGLWTAGLRNLTGVCSKGADTSRQRNSLSRSLKMIGEFTTHQNGR